ncbi:aldo/keto reductase [Streptomyces sp. BI20]|uniref:aldo/keto reductase n=1 Tax=Streptomyces sp. BI20 TaxID=3403460 RepID=UPI003C7557A3
MSTTTPTTPATPTAPAPTRELGRTGIVVPAVALGCMGMSWGYDQEGRDDERSIAVVHRALDLGRTLLDTADQYGPFTNEALLGRALAGPHRARAVLATKGGLVVDDPATHRSRRNGRPEHLRAALEASLTRLRTDHVDLYQLHRVDPAVPLEETWGAMAELVAEGKARRLGLSEVSVDEIERAAAIHPVTSVQSELSLWSREPLADGVLDHCARAGITFLAYAPLGRGFLSGAIRSAADLPAVDGRHATPRFSAEAIAANQPIADRVREVAARHGVSGARVALAWVLARAGNVVALPGSKTLAHLEDNVRAVELVLTEEDTAALSALPAARGTRY